MVCIPFFRRHSFLFCGVPQQFERTTQYRQIGSDTLVITVLKHCWRVLQFLLDMIEEVIPLVDKTYTRKRAPHFQIVPAYSCLVDVAAW